MSFAMEYKRREENRGNNYSLQVAIEKAGDVWKVIAEFFCACELHIEKKKLTTF